LSGEPLREGQGGEAAKVMKVRVAIRPVTFAVAMAAPGFERVGVRRVKVVKFTVATADSLSG